MEITLPGLKNELYLPAQRIHLQDGFRLPYRGRDVRNKEAPCQERQVGLGRRVAFFLRVLPGFSPAFVDDRLGDTRHNQPSRHTLLFPQENRAFQEIPFDRGEPTRQRQWVPLTASCGQEGRLVIEPT